MPKLLTQDQIDAYERDGFVFPVPALTPDEVRWMRADMEAWEKKVGHPVDWPEKSKPYLVFDWADRLVHHPKVLDAVEDVIGPDILVYHTTLFMKEAKTPAYVRWHQDGTYFFLTPNLHVTAWVALSEASIKAGCMQAIPGSHKLGQFPHDDKPEAMNMIKRGQGISDRFDGAQGTFMPLKAGELSLHHTDLVHASGGNDNDDRRIGLAISYIPTCVKPVGAVKPSALLVRGTDRYNHFVPETRMTKADSPEAWAAHTEALRKFRALQDAGFARAA